MLNLRFFDDFLTTSPCVAVQCVGLHCTACCVCHRATLIPLCIAVQVSAKFLPLPAHVQYTFNLRDVARCFVYLYSADPKVIKTKDQWARLWCHECFR